MPDITKCEGHDCPLKEKCYRYTSKDNHRQSYFVEDPRQDPINHPKMCAYFWLTEVAGAPTYKKEEKDEH